MTLIHKNKAILLPAILLLWLSACSAQDKALTSAEMKVPADFNAGQSKTEHTPLTIDQFFTDKVLTALIDTVLQNNADIKIVLQKVEAAKASLMLHRGALMPSLDATVTTGAMQYGRYTVDGSGVAESSEISGPSFYDHFAGLSSSWEADLWGKLKNRKRAA